MIKKWTNDKGAKYLFAGVPEGAYQFEIMDNELWFATKETKYDPLAVGRSISLPSKCKFIGLSKDLTGEQWEDIKGLKPTYGTISIVTWVYLCKIWRKLESGQSLLKSLGFKGTDNIAVLEVEG